MARDAGVLALGKEFDSLVREVRKMPCWLVVPDHDLLHAGLPCCNREGPK